MLQRKYYIVGRRDDLDDNKLACLNTNVFCRKHRDNLHGNEPVDRGMLERQSILLDVGMVSMATGYLKYLLSDIAMATSWLVRGLRELKHILSDIGFLWQPSDSPVREDEYV